MSIKTNIRRKHNELFLANYKLRQLAEEVMALQPEVNSPKDGVAYYTLAKVYKTHGVVLNLAKNGLSEDAEMLARTMFDTTLIALATLQDQTEETAQQYLNFDYVTRIKMFKAVSQTDLYREWFKERLENPKPGDETFEQIEARAAAWMEEFERGGQRWHAGKTTGELAASVGLERYYRTAYGLQSQLIHSLPRAMNRYIGNVNDKIVFDIEPKNTYVDISLVSGFNMLFEVASAFSEHFKLGKETEFSALISIYKEAVKIDVARNG